MDQEDRQHESRRGELTFEPRMGQAFTYGRPAPEVCSPDEGFRREAETSINSMLLWPPYEIGRPVYFCPVVSIYLSIFFLFLA